MVFIIRGILGLCALAFVKGPMGLQSLLKIWFSVCFICRKAGNLISTQGPVEYHEIVQCPNKWETPISPSANVDH